MFLYSHHFPTLKKMSVEALILLVMVSGVQIVNGGTTKTTELPLKYPGPIQDVGNRYGADEVPEQCKNLNYCTIKPPDYPEEEFNKMFKGYKKSVQPTLIVEEVDLGDRQGDPDERDDCETEVTYEPLYKVRTKRGDWRTVVQAPQEDYVQRVRLETCVNRGGRCFTHLPPSSDFETFCKQKFNTWEVLVSDGNNNTEKIKTELPVCCSCHYKINVDLAARFGKPKN